MGHKLCDQWLRYMLGMLCKMYVMYFCVLRDAVFYTNVNVCVLLIYGYETTEL